MESMELIVGIERSGLLRFHNGAEAIALNDQRRGAIDSESSKLKDHSFDEDDSCELVFPSPKFYTTSREDFDQSKT
ncbi:hypothetical protein TNCV_2819561 [Trichonephila clavipes]|nr:hypothetical protein TNCV_2819561 [Trichonephila clavipes]